MHQLVSMARHDPTLPHKIPKQQLSAQVKVLGHQVSCDRLQAQQSSFQRLPRPFPSLTPNKAVEPDPFLPGDEGVRSPRRIIFLFGRVSLKHWGDWKRLATWGPNSLCHTRHACRKARQECEWDLLPHCQEVPHSFSRKFWQETYLGNYLSTQQPVDKIQL